MHVHELSGMAFRKKSLKKVSQSGLTLSTASRYFSVFKCSEVTGVFGSGPMTRNTS